MYRKVKVVLAIVLLFLAATSLYASFSEQSYTGWYSDYLGGTIVGERFQQCFYAYQWGEETNIANYVYIAPCD